MNALRTGAANLVARLAYAAVTNGNAVTLTVLTLLGAYLSRVLHLQRRKGESP